jgi:hypothetical protein
MSLGCFCFVILKPTHWNHIKIVSKSYQNRIKIETCPWAVSVSFCLTNHIKIVSKAYQNRIKTISKP